MRKMRKRGGKLYIEISEFMSDHSGALDQINNE
jgi:hypothetical protein